MALSHFKNSHAAVNKWEVVNPAMFEVTILPPTLDGQQDDKTNLYREMEYFVNFITDNLSEHINTPEHAFEVLKITCRFFS